MHLAPTAWERKEASPSVLASSCMHQSEFSVCPMGVTIRGTEWISDSSIPEKVYRQKAVTGATV